MKVLGYYFEQLECQVGEEEVTVETGDQISPSVARAALARVAEEASRQPMLVRRLARKHQVRSELNNPSHIKLAET